MNKILITEIIKEVVNDEIIGDPFNNNFDKNKLDGLIRAKLQSHKLNASEVEQKIISDTLEIIEKFNNYHNDLLDQFQELTTSINLTEAELIEQLLTLCNYDYFKLEKVNKEKRENKKFEFKDFTRHELENIKDINNEDINIQDANDTIADSFDTILKIINEQGLTYSHAKVEISTKSHLIMLRRLMFIGNIYYNIKNAFDEYKNEFSSLEYEGTNIKIKYNIADYYFIKSAGKKRYDSILMESIIEVFNIDIKETNFPLPEVKNGFVYPEKQETRKSNLDHYFLSIQASFYSHLTGIKLIEQNYTINEIFSFCLALRKLFDEFDAESILKHTIDEKTLNYIPRKIEKKRLVKYICKISGLEGKYVVKLLSYISAPQKSIFSIWKRPFISYKDYYLFLVLPLSNGQVTYLVDQILSYILTLEERSKRLAISMEQEIVANPEFKFVKLAKENYTPLRMEKNLLSYETASNILLIKILDYNHPLDSSEYGSLINQMENEAILLNKVGKELNKTIGRESEQKLIIPIILTNYPFLSGFNINASIILDLFLLKNYIKSGRFLRALFVQESDIASSRKLTEYPYYNSEEEFNNKLLLYCLNPFPISVIIDEMEVRSRVIIPTNITPKLFSDSTEFISQEQAYIKKINEVKYCLDQFYYFGSSEQMTSDSKAQLNRKLGFLLPEVFTTLALATKSREDRNDILYLFRKTGFNSYANLVFLLNTLVAELMTLEVKDDNIYADKLNADHDKAQRQLDEILQSNNLTEIQISKIKLVHQLSDEDYKNLILYLEQNLAVFKPKIYDEEELKDYVFVLSIYIGIIRPDQRDSNSLRAAVLNFVDILNFNNHYQYARNFSEEFLEYSFKNEAPPILGWLCFFKCFLKQNNFIEAGFYGCLYASALTTVPTIAKSELIDVLFITLMFFRDIGYVDLSDQLYQTLISLDLHEYEEQKVRLAYFNSQLKRKDDRALDFIEQVENFFKKNFAQIVEYGSQGALPWLIFLYNLKNVLEYEGKEKFPGKLVSFLEELEAVIDEITLKNLQGLYFAIPDVSKEVLKGSLAKAFVTGSYEQLQHELSRLEILANNVLEIAIAEKDYDSILLTSLILNDNSVAYKESIPKEKYGKFFDKIGKDFSHLSNYSNHLLSNLSLQEGQVLIWLFEVREKVYLMQINSNKNMQIDQLPLWNTLKMDSWINNEMSRFHFDDKSGGYSINEQEQEYAALLNDLFFSKLNISQTFSEILLVTSKSMALFPSNLLQGNFSDKNSNYNLHYELIQNAIKENNSDFISFHHPITNIISFEWFLENGRKIKCSKKELSPSAWVPIEEGNMTILIGNERIGSVIQKYKGKIYNETMPSSSLNSTINIFLAHGTKSDDGFLTLYTSEERALTKDSGLKRIIGEGLIAVFFVCNSGSMSIQNYSQKLIAFTNEILSMDYKAVLAPAWQLNAEITGVWLEHFLDALTNQLSLGEAVHTANVQISKNGYQVDQGFYDPSGWAAMHLFGNPNIIFE